MEYTQLGRTGLKVSRLCLGTMNFGPKTTEEESFEIMDKAHDLGINFFDTAKVYGKMGDWPNQSRLSALNIRNAVEGSLKRLQTDYIDIYQMHHVDRNTPWEEIWQAMETRVQQGKVLYVGSSNFAGWHIAKANQIAKSRHLL